MTGSGIAPSDVIVPPKEIRTFVDRTATFVARNGLAFEDVVRQKERGNPRFQFLDPESPYHAYYKYRVENPVTEEEVKERSSETVNMAEPVAEEKVVEHHAVKRKPPPRPVCALRTATGVRLRPKTFTEMQTAGAIAAVNGTHTVSSMRVREGRRAPFLYADSPEHSAFLALTSAYSSLLSGWSGGESHAARLERLGGHAAFIAEERQRARTVVTEETHHVDWNDFVVVETITFDDDEAMAEKETAAKEEMDVDVVDNGGVQKVRVVSEEEAAQRLARRKQRDESSGIRAAHDPVSGTTVPLESVAEHMRVNLLDKGWKEQKEREREKFRTTNIANDNEMVHSLSAFARQRPDIFGGVKAEARKDSQKAAPSAEDERIRDSTIWDGWTASKDSVTAAAMTQNSIDAQIRQIHERIAMAPPPMGPTLPSTQAPMASMPPSVEESQFVGVPQPPQRPQVPVGMPVSHVPQVNPLDPGLNSTGEKRRRPETVELVDEQEWIDKHANDEITVVIEIPSELKGKDWSLSPGTLVVDGLRVADTVMTLKAKFEEKSGMPRSKMKLRAAETGVFLKDKDTLAKYNVQRGTVLELSSKERGGRKR